MQRKIIPNASYKRTAWKNGLGVTSEIAIFPENATLKEGNFLWRLSSAQIEKSSPFSEFPHHDRTLVILEGKGVRLFHTYMEGEEPEMVELPTLEAYDFPGDVPSRCELIGGAVRDLSVFIRKGEVEVFTEVRELSDELEWEPSGQWNFAFVVSGSVKLATGETLAMGDTLAVELDAPEALGLRSISGSATLVLVSIQ